MKNLINEKPTDPLRPRQTESIKFVDTIDLQGKKVLDVGCGYGWFEFHALERGVKKIAGIEIKESDFESAVKQVADKRAEFKTGSALKIPYEDNTFDTVVCWEVIEHIPAGTERRMFREISRVLKDKGCLYISTPYDSPLSKYLDPAWWLIGHRHYSEQTLRSICKGGFKVVKIMKKGRYWSLLLLLNFYFSKWFLRRNALGNDFFSKKESIEYRKDSGFMQVFVKYKKK